MSWGALPFIVIRLPYFTGCTTFFYYCFYFYALCLEMDNKTYTHHYFTYKFYDIVLYEYL